MSMIYPVSNCKPFKLIRDLQAHLIRCRLDLVQKPIGDMAHYLNNYSTNID